MPLCFPTALISKGESNCYNQSNVSPSKPATLASKLIVSRILINFSRNQGKNTGAEVLN